MLGTRNNLPVSLIVGAIMGGLLMIHPKPTTAVNEYSGYATPIALAASYQPVDSNQVIFPTVNPIAAAQPSRMDIWLEKLAKVESNGKENSKVLDSNGYYSYGCLQFQMGTFQSYMKRYNLIPAGMNPDWKTLIYNCTLQKSLARRMIQDKYANWRHWYNSVVGMGIGLPPREQLTLNK